MTKDSPKSPTIFATILRRRPSPWLIQLRRYFMPELRGSSEKIYEQPRALHITELMDRVDFRSRVFDETGSEEASYVTRRQIYFFLPKFLQRSPLFARQTRLYAYTYIPR